MLPFSGSGIDISKKTTRGKAVLKRRALLHEHLYALSGTDGFAR